MNDDPLTALARQVRRVKWMVAGLLGLAVLCFVKVFGLLT